MTSERSKRRDFLSLIFIAKSISKKLLIKKMKIENKLSKVKEMDEERTILTSKYHSLES